GIGQCRRARRRSTRRTLHRYGVASTLTRGNPAPPFAAPAEALSEGPTQVGSDSVGGPGGAAHGGPCTATGSHPRSRAETLLRPSRRPPKRCPRDPRKWDRTV